MSEDRVTWSRIPLSKMTAVQIHQAKERLAKAWKAELPKEAVYRYTGLSEEEIEHIKRADPSFAELEIECYGMLNSMARINIAGAIREGDLGMSWKYLERTDDQFKTKPTVNDEVRRTQTLEERRESFDTSSMEVSGVSFGGSSGGASKDSSKDSNGSKGGDNE